MCRHWLRCNACIIQIELNSECIPVIDWLTSCGSRWYKSHYAVPEKGYWGWRVSPGREWNVKLHTTLHPVVKTTHWEYSAVAGTFRPCMWLEKLLSEKELEMKASQWPKWSQLSVFWRDCKHVLGEYSDVVLSVCTHLALGGAGVAAAAHKRSLSVEQTLLPCAGHTAQHWGAGAPFLVTHTHCNKKTYFKLT